MKTKKLYCIPYAGGLAGYYRKFSKYLSSYIEVCPIELAGRGIRKNEDFYASFDDMVEDVYRIITSDIGSEPYYIFGHSMGGLISYELCQRLEENKQKIPEQIFFSSIYPPYVNESINSGNLSDEVVQEELLKWGGTSTEFFNDQELLDHFLPVIKADLRLIEGYALKDKVINTNITVLWGNEDKEFGIMEGWRSITNDKCKLIEFEGGHFYINSNLKEVANVINDTINDK